MPRRFATILRKRNRDDGLFGWDLAGQLAVGRVPEANDLIGPGGCQPVAIVAEGEGRHGPLGLEPARRGGRKLPEPCQPVRPRRHEQSVIGKISEADDGVRRCLDRRVGCEVAFPEPNCVGFVAGGELAAVAAPRGARHFAGVSLEVLDSGPGGQVPDLDRLPARRGELLAVGLDRQRLERAPDDRRTSSTGPVVG